MTFPNYQKNIISVKKKYDCWNLWIGINTRKSDNLYKKEKLIILKLIHSSSYGKSLIIVQKNIACTNSPSYMALSLWVKLYFATLLQHIFLFDCICCLLSTFVTVVRFWISRRENVESPRIDRCFHVQFPSDVYRRTPCLLIIVRCSCTHRQ